MEQKEKAKSFSVIGVFLFCFILITIASNASKKKKKNYFSEVDCSQLIAEGYSFAELINYIKNLFFICTYAGKKLKEDNGYVCVVGESKNKTKISCNGRMIFFFFVIIVKFI